MPRVRAKRWCFTLNNPTSGEEELLQQFLTQLQTGKTSYKSITLTYIVFGKEAVSTLHLQGYLETETKTSLSSMKTLLKRAHWEAAKGTAKQAAEYCKKDGDFKEAGVISKGRGYRADLEKVQEEIDAGTSIDKIAETHFSLWCQYRRSFQAYADRQSPKRNWKTIVVVLWGDTGTGKTRFCHEQAQGRTLWISGDYQWFDGYNGQDVVLLDDYRGEYPVQLFLKLTDRYRMSVPIKGGFVNWCPKKIYITSNVDPSTWYQNCGSRTHEAFMRRLTVVNFINKSIY